MTARELSARLNLRVEDLCEELLPGGKKISNEYRAAGIAGGAGESLAVHLTGTKTGAWCDFAESNLKGDLIRLIMESRNLKLKEACDYAKKFLGIFDISSQFEKESKIKSKNYTRPTITPSISTKHIDYLTSRKLSKETIELFKIYSNDYLGGSIYFPSYVENELYRIRYLKIERPDGKKETKPFPNSEPCLFGWQALDGTELNIIICEGEIDAMSWHEYGFHALSVPMGCGGHQWVETEFERLSPFNEIFISFDQDKAGIKGSNELIKKLGEERCRLIKLPHKDCNECLIKGVTIEQMQSFVLGAKRCDPPEFELLTNHSNKSWEIYYPDKNQSGIAWPWKETENLFRIMPAEYTVWVGINGHGKSSFLNEILLHTIAQGEKVCVASMEITPARFLYYLTRNLSGGVVEPSREYFDKMVDYLRDKIYSFNLLGRVDYKRILEVFAYANQRYGINHFLIDSFMKLNIGIQDYDKQQEFVDDLCLFKMKYNCHVHLIVHPRKMEDEKNPPGKMDVKASGFITDNADNGFSIWRNVLKDRNNREEVDAKIECWKNKNGEVTGELKFWYHAPSRQFSPRPSNIPIIKIEK